MSIFPLNEGQRELYLLVVLQVSYPVWDLLPTLPPPLNVRSSLTIFPATPQASRDVGISK